MTTTSGTTSPNPPLWMSMLLTAMAGGMGWGIRGQYGHETGAMIAGVLVSLVLVMLYCPNAHATRAARAAAWGAVAIGIGGSMTYGQTLGLTQNPAVIGNPNALAWGLLGCAIKGSAWIGFSGLFLGMGLGGLRYTPRELLALLLALVGVYFIGVWLLNDPFDPANRRLPSIYFSATWEWEPNAEKLKPRREVWGGLWFALIGALAYLRYFKQDRLATRLGLWAILGGAIGFPLGQSLQAFHAWNPELFKADWIAPLAQHMNWWNWMETTFGATFGAILGWGCWVHRHDIHSPTEPAQPAIKTPLEITLLVLHLTPLVVCGFWDVPSVELYQEIGLVLAIIPLIAIAAGNWWPWFALLPVTLTPIAIKTLYQTTLQDHYLPPIPGWFLLLILPLTLSVLAVLWAHRQGTRNQPASKTIPPLLLLTAWTFFSLNYVFFHFPWPWSTWTSRTPNGLAFTLCLLGLSLGAFRSWIKPNRPPDPQPLVQS